jgi:glycerophosphoryl diester phosphodiesterase
MTRLAALLLAGLLCGPLAQAAEPLVIAHRGASGYLPEHTLAGYELAVRLGADFIEPDLQLTRDGVLVAMHDDSLQRTTNVASLFAARNGDYRVADFSLAEIATLTVKPTGTGAASYPGFAPAHPELRVPTFQQVIDLAKSQGRVVGIYPEAKQADPVMEDQILATLKRNGYGDAPETVFLQSFSDATLRSLDAKQRAQGLEIPMIVLGSAVMLPDGSARLRVRGSAELTLDDVASFADGVGVTIGNASYPVTKAFITQAHDAGLQVHGWTFAQPEPALAADEYRKYLEMGMDGMFSNYADLAVAARKRFTAR